MPALLAVDLGYRTGLALYNATGRLVWHRSHNVGNAARLARAVERILDESAGVQIVLVEGDEKLARIWRRAAQRRGIRVRVVRPETWRARILLEREQRDGATAKLNARRLARDVIEWSGAPRATSPRTDAAEAILIGLWGVLEEGWLKDPPKRLRG